MRATGSSQTTTAGAHPDLERWIAYHAGEFDDDPEPLQDHLASCNDCTSLVLDLESFSDPQKASDQIPVSEFEKAAVWRALLPQLAPVRPTKSWQIPAALAASFLVITVGGWGWISQQRELDGLRREVADLSRPQANVPVHDLYDDVILRSADTEDAIEIPADTQSFTLILNQLTDAGDDELRALILDASGLNVATVEGLKLDAFGVATLGLSPATFVSGDYVIHIEARRDGVWTEIADFPMKLRFF